MSNNNSRYQSLSGRKPIHQREYFEGYYENKPILFDRVFRGYRFSNEECMALCQGEWLEVHNLQNGVVLYGVRGCLYKDVFASAKSSVPVYIFKVKQSLVNNPTYVFSKRTPYFGPNNTELPYDFTKRMSNDVILPGEPTGESENKSEDKKIQFILHEASLDVFSDEEDSKLAAMVSTTTSLPNVVGVKTNMNNVKVFVPVIAGYRYTENGLEPIEDKEVLSTEKPVHEIVYEDKDVVTVESDVKSDFDEVVQGEEVALYDELFSSDDFEEPNLDEIDPQYVQSPYLVDGPDNIPFD